MKAHEGKFGMGTRGEGQGVLGFTDLSIYFAMLGYTNPLDGRVKQMARRAQRHQEV